jgi:hypothetical protein
MKKATVLLLILFAACNRSDSGEMPSVEYYIAAPDSSVALEVEGQPSQRDTLKTGQDSRVIVRTAKPVLTVPAREIVEARAQEVPDPAHGSQRTWATVRLFFSNDFEARVDRLYSLYPNYYLLFRLNQSFVDMEALGSYPSEGFPGGVFESMDEALAAYGDSGVDLSVAKPLAGEVEERERFEREYRNAAVWFAKCDPNAFERLRAEGIERYTGPISTDDARNQLDCHQRPAFPPVPPGRPDVCAEASERGEHKAGKRDGVWTISNPYGQQIRLDYYRHGSLDRSIWLRDCGGRDRYTRMP